MAEPLGVGHSVKQKWHDHLVVALAGRDIPLPPLNRVPRWNSCHSGVDGQPYGSKLLYRKKLSDDKLSIRVSAELKIGVLKEVEKVRQRWIGWAKSQAFDVDPPEPCENQYLQRPKTTISRG